LREIFCLELGSGQKNLVFNKQHIQQKTELDPAGLKMFIYLCNKY